MASLLILTLAAASAHARGGDPLPGLTAAEVAEYTAGFAAFRANSTTGLGPGFNGTRCYSCHRGPALGGMSSSNVIRFGRLDGGTFDPLDAQGGSLLQEKSFAPECREVVPAGANVVVARNTSSALGDGLIEAIPDQQILDRATAEMAQNPAMAGRVHMVTGVSDGLPHVGRFGWKAQGALIIDVVAEALLNEMGITNALFPTDNAPNGNVGLLAQCDPHPDPEDTTDLLNSLTRLVRYLSPVPRPSRMSAVAMRGEQLFHAVGCDFCHYAGYTSASANPALDGKSVDLYSDLLLHDIGTGDGVVQGDAQGNEFRTAPLWVVRGPYLHDGRARSVEQAIDAHRGQALPVRDAYYALALADQKAIQKFLKAR